MNAFFVRTKISFYIILFICTVFSWGTPIHAAVSSEGSILIISSYNPETSQTSKNISAFLDEYKLLGGERSVVIENMNCKSFSDALLWKEQMRKIIEKYSDNPSDVPSLIIILGQEAWSAYLSQPKSLATRIPVICGMVSRNTVILPEDSIYLPDWEPESMDAFNDLKDCNIVAGYSYDYDVDKNIQLIQDFYPKTKHIAFVSDNSYGGVTMQALVKKKMKKHADLDLILLDGRKHTIYTVSDEISHLPENTSILLGTWRVDKNDGYFMRNATYAMEAANPKIPTFTLASVGLGHWALGGYIPCFRDIGKDMALQVVNYFKNGKSKVNIKFIANQYSFDIKELEKKGFKNKVLPSGSVFVNEDIPFWKEYKYLIISIVVAFFLLLAVLLITLFFFMRTNKLKDSLLISEADLREAKERAEESSRLKTAFLANMSHEIRTPLNAIVGFANVLAIEDNSAEDLKKYFEIIRTNSDLLLNLINDILDISRLEAGRIKFAFEECDIVSLCQIILSSAEYARKTEAKFVLDTPIESFALVTDIQRIQQILINLLSNASKFTPKGQIVLSIKIEKKKNRILFSVSDTGCGIPLEKQKLVFERFEKLNEYAQGTGLGLSICKLTVDRLGGDIWIDPDYTEGARFVFSHPLNISISAEEQI